MTSLPLIDLFASSIFSTNISKFLHQEEISNVYASCKTLKSYIHSEGVYIYTKVCLHQQPHGHFVVENNESSDIDYVIHKWYREGKLHRDRDLPAIESKNLKIWYQNGLVHRNGDLPAVILNETQGWHKFGKRHRDVGPAVIFSDGTKAWYKNGIQIYQPS